MSEKKVDILNTYFEPINNQYVLEAVREAREYGKQLSKTIITLSSGSAAATMTFIGYLVTSSSIHLEMARALAWPLILFFVAALVGCAHYLLMVISTCFLSKALNELSMSHYVMHISEERRQILDTAMAEVKLDIPKVVTAVDDCNKASEDSMKHVTRFEKWANINKYMDIIFTGLASLAIVSSYVLCFIAIYSAYRIFIGS